MHPEIHIQEKLNEQLAATPPLKPRNLWLDVGIYSVVVFIVLSLYLFATEGIYNLTSFSTATADVGVLFIGLSFILSGICYFWDFADHFIIYRKQLGVTGFIYSVVHALTILYREGMLDILVPKTVSSIDDISLISSEIAIIMFGTMIIISTKTVVHEIGGQRWRQLLRVGYFAVLLSLIHMFIKSSEGWIYWLTGNSHRIFPSLGLLVFIFGIAVLVMRIVLWIALLMKKPPVASVAKPVAATPPTSTSPPPSTNP